MLTLNKKILSAMISSVLAVGVAQAAMSPVTPAVVGHKPKLTFNGTKPAAIQLGDTITVNASDFIFTDDDGDLEDARNYVWKLDGNPTGTTGLSYPILITDNASVNKKLTLEIIPTTTSGDPISGDPLVVDFGVVQFKPGAVPEITNLKMTGILQLGKTLGATYSFDSHGGDNTDKSTYKWGRVGQTAAGVSAEPSVTTTEVVDGYLLTAADVGNVVELTVEPKNGVGTIGTKVTINSNGLTGGGTGGEVVDPTTANVRVTFINPAADEAKHGIGSDGRPVVGQSTMTAECKFEGAPVTDFSICNTAIYNLQWKSTADNGTTYTNITDGVTDATYLPHTKHQGLAIAVEATVKP
ncbi:hypothetical protein AEA42_18700 [Shewanella sp. Sh95]|nr:hypothetical protein AEA42_18700 [Shewanella sp. Sh95]